MLVARRTSLHLIEFKKQRMFAICPLLLLIRLEIDMHIKSFLFGAAAALATVSSAHAADAIVAAEPEPLEYVRVCDAFGAGFFYIPGTETCLKFGGYIRFETDFGRNESGTSDWIASHAPSSKWTFARIPNLALCVASSAFVAMRIVALPQLPPPTSDTGSAAFVDQAFIELGGLKVGKFYSWWDDDLSGETDLLSSNTLFNSIRYSYDAGAFTAGISVDELEGITFVGDTNSDNNVGIAGSLAGKFGGGSLSLIGGYDTDREDGAVRLIGAFDVGPGAFSFAGVYASGVNAYYALSEWAVVAEYAYKVTDKLTITPGVQWLGNVATKDAAFDIVNTGWSNNDAWTAGLTVDYKVVEGFTTKVTANYYDEENRPEFWTGFVRLQRDF